MATTNLFEYYDRVRSNTISDMGKASDVAKKLADRSYADANSRIRDMHDDVYVEGGLTNPIVSLESAAATYTGEQWAANGSNINEAVLNNERFLPYIIETSGGLNRIPALAEESIEVSLYESPDAMTLKFNLPRASTVFLLWSSHRMFQPSILPVSSMAKV